MHFDYGVIEKDSRDENHVNVGNYYDDGVGRCLLMKIIIAMGNGAVIILDETTLDEFEAMIHKIVYLNYIGSLNYGYANLNS